MTLRNGPPRERQLLDLRRVGRQGVCERGTYKTVKTVIYKTVRRLLLDLRRVGRQGVCERGRPVKTVRINTGKPVKTVRINTVKTVRYKTVGRLLLDLRRVGREGVCEMRGLGFGAHMRKGSTSFGACEVRCWRWLFGNKIPVALGFGV